MNTAFCLGFIRRWSIVASMMYIIATLLWFIVALYGEHKLTGGYKALAAISGFSALLMIINLTVHHLRLQRAVHMLWGIPCSWLSHGDVLEILEVSESKLLGGTKFVVLSARIYRPVKGGYELLHKKPLMVTLHTLVGHGNIGVGEVIHCDNPKLCRFTNIALSDFGRIQDSTIFYSLSR